MSWHLGRMASFDTESTGVDVENDRIVTAAVLLLGDGRPTETHTWLTDADGLEIPEAATAVHGITTAQARAGGRPVAEVLAQVSALLAEQAAAGAPIVAMNGRFDFTMLDRGLDRAGLPSLVEQAGNVEPLVVDPYVIDKAMDKWRKGKRKLVNLAETYGVRLSEADAHDAGADALAAARIAYMLAVRYPRLQGSAAGLHNLQEKWAREQAESLQEYLRKSDASAVVESAWPLVPRPRAGA
ncbi:exonuclease domain-containing protein [Kitasatospora purpeofusca]|uniref:exonuclease domain-containing protein n=1 Tax=Kitasatospora purpeofusca TaxID=67352 RepID=UPI0035DE689D